jgi:hypothetical protein
MEHGLALGRDPTLPNRGCEEIGEAEEKGRVVERGSVRGFAVDLEHAPNLVLERDRHVEERDNSVLAQEVGIFVLTAARKISDADRFPGAEGTPRR